MRHRLVWTHHHADVDCDSRGVSERRLSGRGCSHGQLVPDRLALLHRLEVVVEEVNVQARLQQGSQCLRPAEEALDLVAVDPTDMAKRTGQD